MAANLATLPGWSDPALTVGGTSLEQNYFAFLKSVIAVVADRDAQIADLQARTQIVEKTGAPAVGDVPPGQFRIIKNTTGPTYALVVNDGGTLKSVALT